MARDRYPVPGHFYFPETFVDYERNKPGERFDFHGMDLVHPLDQIPNGRVPLAINVRRYLKGAIKGRNLLTGAIYTLAAAVHTIRRLNDSTPNGPPSGYALISGAGTVLYLNSTALATGMSGNPVSMIPFRPNTSVQPWMYIGDNSENVLIASTVRLPVTPTMSSSTWTSPANATSSTLFTSASYSAGAGTGALTATIGAQAIPLTATISGILITFSAYELILTPTHNCLGRGRISFSGLEIDNVIVATPGSYAYGGPTNLWGTTITPAQVNLGFTFNLDCTSFGLLGGNTVFINSLAVTIYYSLPNTFATFGMLKVRSDGTIYKMGIKEPQLAPVVSTSNTTVPIQGTLAATAIPWTNYLGVNSSYNYGESNGYPDPTPDGTAPFIVNCKNATSITITSLTGTATINGGSHAPTDTNPAWVAPANPGFPGQFIQIAGTGMTPATASVVVGAFIDATGQVIAKGVAPLYVPSVVDIGLSIGSPIRVPYGAVALQIGINSEGNTFSSNSGSFALNLGVTTNALPSVTSTLGTMSLFYWDDSPHSGPVSAYIWRNPDDPGGSGPTRSTSNAIGNTSGNSFIFDATFTAGIPALPGVGTNALAMQWTTLTPDSVAAGSNAVFPAPLTVTYPTNTQYANFNFCLSGSLYFPAPGNYTLVLTNHDDIIWGIGGGVTLVSASSTFTGSPTTPNLSSYGQTITVVGGYPLLPRGPYSSGEDGNYATTTVVIAVASAGIYPIEIDYDYWFHNGRILLLEASATAGGSPTIIPPLPANVRQDVQYRYVYRSSATGALSNPSPESTAETVPVTANTVTSLWSNDPQVDVVDYYRIDSVTTDFTYVATGPNDNLGGGGTNTPITDSLLDTELSNQILEYDNFEPFPSIDLPQKGICSVSGGVITWVSGGAIGGTFTGFNTRWLGGTIILIGYPTSLAYTLIARPTSNTSMTIPGVPDGSGQVYEIPEPILAAQPLQYLFGPTDNINFEFAVGDPLRPGTLYWCKGSNLDSAPDTNQQDLTDPSEPLVNGDIAGGLGVVFSIKRAWLILPNFFNALATVTGTSGSTWSLQESAITRGLYMPRCVCVSGGGNIFFRVDDGIHMSARGESSQSITDEDLYPLFPHENEDGGTSIPQPVTIAGYTIYPPSDLSPQLQKFSFQNGYMYYDYFGTDSNFHTLVFDEAAMGWVWDMYTPPATIHAGDEGLSSQGTLVGCNDGTIRQLASQGTEVATAVLLTPAADKGDTRASAQWGDLYIETTNP